MARKVTPTRLLVLVATLLFVPLSLRMSGPAGASPARADASTTRIPASYQQALPGGGYEYVYTFSNGATDYFPVPPAGFKPLTATDAQLTEYDFPPRPTQASALAQWTTEMSYYKQTPPTPYLTTTQKYHFTDSGNWSGFMATNPSDTYWVSVQGDFPQPYFDPYVCSNPDEAPVEGSWVGIGGWSSNSALIQAGTQSTGQVFIETVAAGSTPGHVTGYINGGAPLYASWSANPGDAMHFFLSYEQANQRLDLYIADNTTGNAWLQNWPMPDNTTNYNGTSAEWIGERIADPYGGYYELDDPGAINWSNAQAQDVVDGYWNGVGAVPHTFIIMQDSSGKNLMGPGNISNNDQFPDYWWACG